MGKKSRNKHQAPALAAQKKRTAPDDYFRRGPLEIARWGKHVIMRNNMTPEQHRKYMQCLAGQLPEVTKEIDGHVTAIVRIVGNYDPLSLLHRGYWMSILPHIQATDEPEKKSDVLGQRMVDYIQSVIAAVPVKTSPAPEVTDEAWNELSTHVEGLFDTINHAYVQCRTADWKVNGGGPPEEQVEFYVRALAMWCNVTGHRYHFQEIEHLRALITPHSEVFQRLWGIDEEGILLGLDRILHALTRGLGHAMDRMFQAHTDYLKAGEENANDATALEQKLEALKQEPGVQEAFSQLFGVDLYKVDQYLPASLLDDLSWLPGECRDFIDDKPQSGWPTRIWPRSRRPFLKIEGSYYCFDVHTLFDHIYRVLERTVRAKERGYRQTWNERQKEVSENLPFVFFGKLLPGALVWRGVHYEIDEVDAFGRKKWCELDGLMAYEDHLFIIEVKGGTFTAASPETGFESHLKSVERLIFAPMDQGSRFRSWLEKRGTISLCDQQHKVIGTLSREDFAHVTVCAISLDSFTELSAKAYHLSHLVGRHGAEPFWALSVNDLQTYSDLFDNPLLFLHFVEKRNQATASSKVILDDELDHYGMYLQHNNYDLHAEAVAGECRTNWTGYRDAIDKYFDARVRGEPAKLPRQEIPPLYSKIIEVLAASQHPHRRKAASLMLDGDEKMRTDVERSLAETLRLQQKFRRPRPLTIGGKEVRITFTCWQTGVIDPGRFNAEEHCKAAMLAAQEPDRWLIELSFDGNQTLLQVVPTFFSAQKIDAEEKQQLSPLIQQLLAQRLNRSVAEHGKVGRNQLCPCGSGKKYKRCCGN